ncbi:hypothetical protein RUND412_000802 [Rhizina undulata]
MHCNLIFISLLLPFTLTQAWDMEVNYEDGEHFSKHGHTNSGCKEFKKKDSAITSVDFTGSLLADTFVLYRSPHCKNDQFKGFKGNNDIPKARYLSYKS